MDHGQYFMNQNLRLFPTKQFLSGIEADAEVKSEGGEQVLFACSRKLDMIRYD